ncbi:MAG: phosphoserine transaminase [Planctomycetota bacterium]
MNTTAVAKERIFNFSAGPATLPEPVIEQAKQDIWNIFDSGVGIMEHSHRGPVFDRVIHEAIEDCRTVGSISDDYEILFLQGGATTQFGMIPMSFLGSKQTADYANTGVWTTKAIKEAKRFGNVNIAFDGSDTNFDRIPNSDDLELTENAAYFHYCSNNTIYGTLYNDVPVASAPLVCDTSSEMFSRPFDISKHALVYAGAQKNLGPSGVTLVIIRKDFAAQGNQEVFSMMNYQSMIDGGSRFNTPPTFGIYVMGQVFKWIIDQGGLESIEQRNNEKAALIYDAIDQNDGFYNGHSQKDCRSAMNVTFRTPTEELDAKFLAEAAELRMGGLKGHRKVGGIRASIYNAFPREGCQVLADFMGNFAQKNG